MDLAKHSSSCFTNNIIGEYKLTTKQIESWFSVKGENQSTQREKLSEQSREPSNM